MWINRCCAMHSFSLSPENYPHNSRAIFHIDFAYLVFTLKFLTAPTNLIIWSARPSFKMSLWHLETAEWIIFTVTGISICSPWLKLLVATVVLDGFLSSMKGSSLMNWSLSPLFFLTWCNKRCCQAQLHPSNMGQWFFKWGLFLWWAHCYWNQWSTTLIEAAIVSKCEHKQNQKWSTTLIEAAIVSKCKHRQSHFDFLNTVLKKNSN